MKGFNWTCPFCGQPTTIVDANYSRETHALTIDNKEGKRILTTLFIVCPNPDCNRFSLAVGIGNTTLSYGSYYERKRLGTWQLVPQSRAQSFPDYIPKAILDDYNEACLIEDLSPKASATLARRCLQGMIRDYWKVKPGKLANELEQIKDKVDTDTWKAIDGVRSVGNIGAHMEEDVNLIVDIVPNEAELLVNLIEILLRDWYIARHDRESRLRAIVQLAKDKETARKPQRDST